MSCCHYFNNVVLEYTNTRVVVTNMLLWSMAMLNNVKITFDSIQHDLSRSRISYKLNYSQVIHVFLPAITVKVSQFLGQYFAK